MSIANDLHKVSAAINRCSARTETLLSDVESRDLYDYKSLLRGISEYDRRFRHYLSQDFTLAGPGRLNSAKSNRSTWTVSADQAEAEDPNIIFWNYVEVWATPEQASAMKRVNKKVRDEVKTENAKHKVAVEAAFPGCSVRSLGVNHNGFRYAVSLGDAKIMVWWANPFNHPADMAGVNISFGEDTYKAALNRRTVDLGADLSGAPKVLAALEGLSSI